MPQIISVVEGETASFTGQPWPVEGFETRLSTTFTFGTASPSDYQVNNGGYFRVNDYIGDGMGPLLPIIWYVDTIDDDIPEETETSTITIEYEYRASEDAPFITGTFGPITINIIDNDGCDNFFLDVDGDGFEEEIDLAATGLAETGVLLERSLVADAATLRDLKFLIEGLDADARELALGAAFHTAAVTQIPALLLEASVKKVFKGTSDEAFELAKNISNGSISAFEFSQNPSFDSFFDTAMSGLQLSGGLFSILGFWGAIGNTIINDVWLPRLTANTLLQIIDSHIETVGVLEARIESVEAIIEELKTCQESISPQLLASPSPTFNFQPQSNAPLNMIGDYVIKDFSVHPAFAQEVLQSNDIVLGTLQDDKFNVQASSGIVLLDGDTGFDEVSFDSSINDFSTSVIDDLLVLSTPTLTIVSKSVERFVFSDYTLNEFGAPIADVNPNPVTAVLDSGVSNINVDGDTNEFIDFGGEDTYTLLNSLSNDVTIVDNNPSVINMPEGLTITDASFLADGVQFTINGSTVTLLGNLGVYNFVFGGTPLDPAAGTIQSFEQTAAAFGTSVPSSGQSPNLATSTGPVQTNGSIGDAAVFASVVGLPRTEAEPDYSYF